MPIKKIVLILLIICPFVIISHRIIAQDDLTVPDSLPIRLPDELLFPPYESPDDEDINYIFLPADSAVLAADTTVVETDSVEKKSNAIDAPIYYEAEDSIIMIGTNFIQLYGNAVVTYQDMELTGEYIEIRTDSSTVYAMYGLDSLNNEIGYPVFTQGSEAYEAKKMRYNFKTKRAYINDVVTQQGEGYVTSTQTKKMPDNVMFMVDGKYTTCDQHDHPHFYLQLTKAKVRPGKDIVTGPAYLVIEDVPLPVAIPFGFFPFKDNYSSGVIMPSYGDEMTRGFSLRDGGYYFAFNDYMDLALTGEIYTKGSWGLNARSTYRKRYKFSGNFNIGYLVTKTGDKDAGDYAEATDFKVNWSHSQDAKANPYRTISARVDFSTSSYDRNSVSGLYSGAYTNNVKSSSVTINQTFPNSPVSLNANMLVNQRSQDSTVSVTLPSLGINVRQTYPFKRKNPVGNPKWYESITVSYSGRVENKITTKEDKLFKSNLIKDWKNGMSHSIPVSATFNVFKYINLTPSVNYSENWHTTKITQDYDVNQQRWVPNDTTYGFYRTYSYSASISANTKLYGFYKPLKIFGDKVRMIRHVATPRVSFSGAPDFSDPRYGFYTTKTYMDASGQLHEHTYSPYSNNLYGVPGAGQSAIMTMGLDNNLEMKIRTEPDSAGVDEKKISLIDNLSLNTNYNFLKDSLRWGDLNASLRLKLSKSYTISLSGAFELYMYDYEGNRYNQTRLAAGRGIGRFKGTSTSFSYTFNNSTFKKWFNRGEKQADETPAEAEAEAESGFHTEAENPDDGPLPRASLRSGTKELGDFDQFGYMIANIPWSLSFNYSISYTLDMRKEVFDKVKREYPYKITQNLGLSGNVQPTKGWRFNFSTYYDFSYKKFITMNCTVVRDLHCWSMSASFIPIGPYQSYNFTLSVSSSMLQDLKYQQSSNYRDAINWY